MSVVAPGLYHRVILSQMVKGFGQGSWHKLTERFIKKPWAPEAVCGSCPGRSFMLFELLIVLAFALVNSWCISLILCTCDWYSMCPDGPKILKGRTHSEHDGNIIADCVEGTSEVKMGSLTFFPARSKAEMRGAECREQQAKGMFSAHYWEKVDVVRYCYNGIELRMRQRWRWCPVMRERTNIHPFLHSSLFKCC